MADDALSKLDDSYMKLISRIEWVLVSRNDTLTTDLKWKFDVVVFAENDEDSQLPVHSVEKVQTTTSSSQSGVNDRNCRYLYYDKSNDRCGWRVINDNNNNNNNMTLSTNDDDTEQQKISSKKRKRNNSDHWLLRYYYSTTHLTTQLHTDSTKQNFELLVEDQYVVDPRHLIPIYRSNNINHTSIENKKIPILITDTTDLYRVLAASQIHLATESNDNNNNQQKESFCSVLEIGSSTGMTSEIVWKQLHQYNNNNNQHHRNNDSMYQHQRRCWIGFDTGAEMVQIVQNKYKKLYPNKDDNNNSNNIEWASCYNMDPLLDPDTASTVVNEYLGSPNDNTDTNGNMIHYVTVLVDIGGNREENAVLRMIDWVLRIFQSKSTGTNQLQLHQIILKSESLYTTLSNRTNISTESIWNATDWYNNRLRIALRESLPKHPLQAPKRFVPIHKNGTCSTDSIGNNNDTPIRLICRYHNYHKDGCAKMDNGKCNSGKKLCPYDHDHCHLCLMVGHIARNCPLTS
jgi:uncharacterized membrane-anchored protein YhcB (DUF1043 family)